MREEDKQANGKIYIDKHTPRRKGDKADKTPHKINPLSFSTARPTSAGNTASACSKIPASDYKPLASGRCNSGPRIPGSSGKPETQSSRVRWRLGTSISKHVGGCRPGDLWPTPWGKRTQFRLLFVLKNINTKMHDLVLLP